MERIVAASKWLAGIAFAAVLAMWIWRGFIGDGIGIFWLILIAFWQCAPVVATAACVRASPGQSWAAVFLGLEAALALWTLGLAFDSLVPFRSRLPAVDFVFDLYLFPVVQLAVLAAALGLAFLIGWRARPGWRET